MNFIRTTSLWSLASIKLLFLSLNLTAATPLSHNGGSISGSINPGNFQQYEVSVPANRDGWRLVLNTQSPTGDADLYVRKDTEPSINTYDRISKNKTPDTMLFSDQELAEATYFVGVYLPADASGPVDFTLYSENSYVNELTWDPGTAATGTEVHFEPNASGGDYYFRLITETPDFGAWRSALRVNNGEADLYWSQNSWPNANQGFQVSENVGPDGFVEPLSPTTGAGQEWFFLVSSTEGADWSFLAGDVHIEELGTLAAGASSSSTLSPVGPEGARFFRTQLPADMLAWRLWVNDGTESTVPAQVLTRRNLAPLLQSAPSLYERIFVGQDLLVPGTSAFEYEAGTGEPYFVGVYANPGTEVLLDNRKQAVTDTTYQSTTSTVTSTGYHFHTFRVQVPLEQIAWEATSRRITGDPDLAVRKNLIPNSRLNDFSSAVGGSVNDSIAVVPNILADGTFYITVHSDNLFSFQLFNGEPVITELDFVDTIINDEPNRVGWKFYSIPQDNHIGGQLGWRLDLTNQAPGTEIYTRRTSVPGPGFGQFAQRSNPGYLQEPVHEADNWYIGIFQPDTALGAFTLESGSITPSLVTIDGGTDSVASLAPDQWTFYRIEVPSQIDGQDLLGWEIRVKDWTGGSPQLVVRRGNLSNRLANVFGNGAGGYGSFISGPGNIDFFLSGQQHFASTDQWTSRSGPNGEADGVDRVLSLAMDNPLEPGTYYVGVFNQSTTEDCAFTFQSRAIGEGMGLSPVALSPGSDGIVNNLAPREPAYFKFELPAGVEGWQFELDFSSATSGAEAMLILRKDFVPNSQRNDSFFQEPYLVQNSLSDVTYQTELKIAGRERLTVLPANGENELPAGTYYAMVVSEGNNPTNSSYLGTGNTDLVLRNTPSPELEDLGTINFGSSIQRTDNLQPGENQFFRFTVPANAPALAISLAETQGTPAVALRTLDNGLPQYNQYGLAGGQLQQESIFNSGTITLSNPMQGDYALLVRDQGANSCTYNLTIEIQEATPLTFDGGTDSIANLGKERWQYYRFEVPSQVNGEDILGWELRVKDWTGGSPQLAVRRDVLPDQVGNYFSDGSGGYSSPQSQPGRRAFFLPGQQHSSGSDQWTNRSGSNGETEGVDRVLSLTKNNPLEPGTYYVGIYNQSNAEDCTFTLESRAIGNSLSLAPVDLIPGNDGTVSNLSPREPVYFRFELPAGVEGWQFELDFGAAAPDGEAMLVLRKGHVPNSQRNETSSQAPYVVDPSSSGQFTSQTELDIQGQERITILPAAGESELPAGTYYAMVVSEGNNPTHPSYIGTGNTDLVLRNTPLPKLESLGTIAFGNPVQRTGDLLPGENQFFRFTVPANTSALAVNLTDTAGSPAVALRTLDDGLPTFANQYGLAGGQPAQESIFRSGTITLSNPAPGDYALLVRDQGANPCSYDLTIETQGAQPLAFDGGTDSVTVLGEERWQYYLVNVPSQIGGEDILGWELRVKDWTGGSPQLVVRRDSPPDRLGNYFADGNGNYGSPQSQPGRQNSIASGQQHYSFNDQWTRRSNATGLDDGVDRVLSLAVGNPLEPGTYYVGVYNQSTTENCSFTLQSRAIGESMSLSPVTVFPGSEAAVNNLAPREPAYFKFELPSGVEGWQFELDFGTATPNGEAMLVLRKNFIPNSQRNDSYFQAPYLIQSALDGITFQTEFDIAGQERVTILPANGESELPAGTYYAMVVAEGNTPSDQWRIGSGNTDLILRNSFPPTIIELGSANTTTPLTHPNSVPKGGAAFYRYQVTNQQWPLEIWLKGLNGTSSSGFLSLTDEFTSNSSRYGVVGGANPWTSLSSNTVFTLDQPTLGTHALTIQSQSPISNGSEFELSVVQKTPRPLGFSSLLAGTPSNASTFNLANGQYEFFEVEVPATLNGQEFLGWLLQVETTTGSATVSTQLGQLPLSTDHTNESSSSFNRLYLGNPFVGFFNVPVDLVPGTWYVQVLASGPAIGTLTSEAIFAQFLNIDESQNENGFTHTDSQLYSTGEKKFFKVEIPPSLDGEEVLGWNLTLEKDGGNAAIKVNPGQLPINFGSTPFIDFTGDLLLDAIQSPPGTYYVEVDCSSAGEFTLTSTVITASDLARIWTMPARGETTTTPGLAPPLFGDSGVDETGSPLPGDRGRDLSDGTLDFYAIEVPEGNEGILRAQLSAISGNPDLYIRRGALTSDDSVHDYSLRANAISEYGNWVAADGLFEKQLPPGTYYLAVHAASSTNARYRLLLSTGSIENLALNDGGDTNEFLVSGDWKYYRVALPLDLPVTWELDFSVSQGNVQMYLRDSVPPGTLPNNSIRHWGTETLVWWDPGKNQSPYEFYSSPTTALLSSPQLRPGHTYYVGFRATTDSTFSVTSTTSGGTRSDPPLLDFFGETASGTLAPGEKQFYRVSVPEEAARWKHNAIHSNLISIYLEQGSFPSETTSDDRFWMGGQDTSLNQTLSGQNWPWVGGESYYLAIVNEGTASEDFELTLDGKNLFTDDEDGDSIPDQWERDFFNTTGYSADSDSIDNDGTPLLLEYFFALDPTLTDQPEFRGSHEGNEFWLEFRKASQTPLMNYKVTHSVSLDKPAPWPNAFPALELLSEDEDSQLWRARITLDEKNPAEFFRIEVN